MRKKERAERWGQREGNEGRGTTGKEVEEELKVLEGAKDPLLN